MRMNKKKLEITPTPTVQTRKRARTALTVVWLTKPLYYWIEIYYN